MQFAGARPECGRSQKIRAELPDPATNRIGQPETANTQEKDPMSQTPYIYEDRRRSFLSCCYSFQEVLPGLLAMFFIAIFSNNLAGVPNPFTLENLFRYLDAVIGPINGPASVSDTQLQLCVEPLPSRPDHRQHVRRA